MLIDLIVEVPPPCRSPSHHRDQCFAFAAIDAAAFENPFLSISCPKFAQSAFLPPILISTSPFKHAPSNFLNVLSIPKKKRRSLRFPNDPSILSFFAIPSPSKSGGKISSQNLPIRPSFLSGTFLSIFHCQIDSSGRGIILEAPKFRSHHQFAAEMASKGDNRCLIYTLILPLCPNPLLLFLLPAQSTLNRPLIPSSRPRPRGNVLGRASEASSPTGPPTGAREARRVVAESFGTIHRS